MVYNNQDEAGLGQKTSMKVNGKAIKMKEERQFLARYLIIEKCRPDLVPKLETVISQYEMSVVQRPLCSVDGTLYIPKDKAAFMLCVEEFECPDTSQEKRYNEPSSCEKVLLVDAMATLQSMKKTPTLKTIGHLVKAYIKRVKDMLDPYKIGRILTDRHNFDRYIDQTLKSKTRQDRSVQNPVDYQIHYNMKFVMSMKELLSSSKTKRLLTILIAEEMLK